MSKPIAMRQLLALIFLITSCQIFAATVDDNIVIKDGTESYTFVPEAGNFIVKNRQKHTFEATRHGQWLRSQMFYSDRIRLDGASGKGKAQYRNASADGIFHDDSRICYYEINLEAKGKKATTEFRRTFTDAAFFAKIFLQEPYPIASKTLQIDIPAQLSRIELIDLNMPADGSIARADRTMPDGSRTVTYTITSLPALCDDESAPAPFLDSPCILIKGWFPDVDALYRWEHDISHTDTAIPDTETLIAQIVNNDNPSEQQRLADTFRWVQQNIRYIAYEEGEAGHRPDAPAEVLRKRYGDCKGMALLLATLLRHQGFDADIASGGTSDIPFDIAEIPSLAAANHMICVVRRSGQPPLFLDPTTQHTPWSHIPYSIAGKDAFVHNGDSFSIERIPGTTPEQSTDNLTYTYMLLDGRLIGHATRTFTGDMMESALRSYHGVKKNRQAEALALMLVPSSRVAIDTDHIKLNESAANGTSATVSADISNRQAVTESDGTLYLDLNTSGDPCSSRIDTYKRTADYMLPFPSVITRSTTVVLPVGYNVTYLPENFAITTPQGTMQCTFEQYDGTVRMTKTMTIDTPRIRLDDIPAWNDTLAKWNDACNRQIEITPTR